MENKDWKNYQLHFDYRIANKYGIEEAIVINKFQILIESNKIAGRNYFQGRTWTFNSYEEWVSDAESKRYFPCFSPQQMRRVLDSLVKQNVLLKGNFNKRKNDKTNWYAFLDEEIWIDANSPISNYGSDRTDEFALPKTTDQKDLPLFNNETLPESAENDFPLPESTDQTKQTAEFNSETAEIDASICQDRQNDVPDSTEHYQKDPNTSNDDAKEKQSAVFDRQKVLLTIVKKEVIHSVNAGLHELICRDMNLDNMSEVHRRIEQLFRIFVDASYANQTDGLQMNVNRIMLEMDDEREELKDKRICWLIIERTFADYPSWDKVFKNVKSIEGRIQKQKSKFVSDWKEQIKNRDINHYRSIQTESDKKQEKDFNERTLADAEDLLNDHGHELTRAEIEAIKKAIEEKIYLRIDRLTIEAKRRLGLIDEEAA